MELDIERYVAQTKEEIKETFGNKKDITVIVKYTIKPLDKDEKSYGYALYDIYKGVIIGVWKDFYVSPHYKPARIFLSDMFCLESEFKMRESMTNDIVERIAKVIYKNRSYETKYKQLLKGKEVEEK